MGQNVGRAFNVRDWVFPLVTPSYDESHKLLVQLPSEFGVAVPAMLLAPSTIQPNTLGSVVSTCVIYFHANACDIGQCVDDMCTFRDGALDGDGIVLCPEYPGYGLLREYRPSVSAINLVAQTAWNYCRKELGFNADQIMLWGRSIGSGPATALAKSLAAAMKLENQAAGLEDTSTTASSEGSPNQPVPKPVVSSTRPRPVGALVLLAPFISISAVIQHHVASQLIASIVGSMWDNLEVVKDSCMEEVPLCIIHPKTDDVVPGTHGQAIFEAATCKDKYGIWLCNASHNLFLTEERLQLTRRFLNQVSNPGRNRTRRRRLSNNVANKAASVPKGSMSDPDFDVDAEEWQRIATQLIEMGSEQRVEQSVWMSL